MDNYDKRGIQPSCCVRNWTIVNFDHTMKESLLEHCQLNFNEPELAKVFRQQEQEEIKELWQKSNGTYSTLIKAFQLKTVEQPSNQTQPVSNRKKRHAALIAAAAALPIVGLGITYWESLRVRNYVKKLEAKFEDLSRESLEFNKKQIRFNENVIKLSQDVQENQEKLSCDLDIVAYQILRRKQVNKWIRPIGAQL